MTRMIPPQSSARSLRAMPHPKRMPNIRPTIDKANDTKPIIPMGERMAENCLMPRRCKRNTYRQCIDAGCHGQSEHHLQTSGVILVLATFVLEGFHYHTSTQKGKDTECYPMVDTFYQMAEKTCAYPSQQRHQSLEKPKLMLITSIGRSRTRFNIIPLAIETAKQSIASPTASSQISNPVISAYRGSL